MAEAEIFIQMKDRYVYTGDQVNGIVHVKVNRVCEAATVTVMLSGEETTQLVKKVVSYSTNSKGRRTSRTSYHTRTDSKKVTEQEFVVYKGMLSPGVFSFPISKLSSTNWPGTYRHDFKMYGRDCFAYVDYLISARLNDTNKTAPLASSSTPLFIVQSPSQVSLDVVNFKEETKVIKGCDCDCCLRGDLRIKATFTKVFYKQNDVAEIFVDIDNSKCKVDLKNFQCYFAQKLHYKCSFESFTPQAVHFSRDGVRIKAGEVKNGVKFEIPIAHEKAGLLYPSFKGDLVSSSYVLVASAEANTCFSTPLTAMFDIQLLAQDALLSKWKIDEPVLAIPANYEHHMMPAAFLQEYPSQSIHAKAGPEQPPGSMMSQPMPFSSEHQATPIAQPRDMSQASQQMYQ